MKLNIGSESSYVEPAKPDRNLKMWQTMFLSATAENNTDLSIIWSFIMMGKDMDKTDYHISRCEALQAMERIRCRNQYLISRSREGGVRPSPIKTLTAGQFI